MNVIHPGDTLLVMANGNIGQHEAMSLQRSLREEFPELSRIVILSNVYGVAVYRDEPGDEQA